MIWFGCLFLKALDAFKFGFSLSIEDGLSIDVWNDDWFFDVPMNLKPTFLYMDAFYGISSVSDLITNEWFLELMICCAPCLGRFLLV